MTIYVAYSYTSLIKGLGKMKRTMLNCERKQHDETKQSTIYTARERKYILKWVQSMNQRKTTESYCQLVRWSANGWENHKICGKMNENEKDLKYVPLHNVKRARARRTVTIENYVMWANVFVDRLETHSRWITSPFYILIFDFFHHHFNFSFLSYSRFISSKISVFFYCIIMTAIFLLKAFFLVR